MILWFDIQKECVLNTKWMKVTVDYHCCVFYFDLENWVSLVFSTLLTLKHIKRKNSAEG